MEALRWERLFDLGESDTMDFLRFLRGSAACDCGSSTCFANDAVMSFGGGGYGDSHGVCYVLTWWEHVVDAHSR
eukprot:3157311-Rhodomonas_salina.1